MRTNTVLQSDRFTVETCHSSADGSRLGSRLVRRADNASISFFRRGETDTLIAELSLAQSLGRFDDAASQYGDAMRVPS